MAGAAERLLHCALCPFEEIRGTSHASGDNDRLTYRITARRQVMGARTKCPCCTLPVDTERRALSVNHVFLNLCDIVSHIVDQRHLLG